MNYRLGCVPYVNAYPLVETVDPRWATVFYDEPSHLPGYLERGEATVVLASSFEAFFHPHRTVAEGVGIASDGPCESVRVFSRVPFESIQTLALDASSLTSNHLARILLIERHRVHPQCATSKPDLHDMLTWAEAAVLIGDRGMEAAGTTPYEWDLGEIWTETTGLPFVWALWIGAGPLSAELVDGLNHARNEGERGIEVSIERATWEREWSRDRAERYLTQTMRYRLDHRFRDGLELYGDLLAKHGFLPHGKAPLRWQSGETARVDSASKL